jgi:hypothetical protein
MWVCFAIRKAKGTIWYNSKKNNVSHVVWCGLAEILCHCLHHKQHENRDLTRERSPAVLELASVFVLIPNRDLEYDSLSTDDMLAFFLTVEKYLYMDAY